MADHRIRPGTRPGGLLAAVGATASQCHLANSQLTLSDAKRARLGTYGDTDCETGSATLIPTQSSAVTWMAATVSKRAQRLAKVDGSVTFTLMRTSAANPEAVRGANPPAPGVLDVRRPAALSPCYRSEVGGVSPCPTARRIASQWALSPRRAACRFGCGERCASCLLPCWSACFDA